MQIRNTHNAAEVQGLEANKFGFEMNAKMYDILISKMYTNKPGAVIRELSANAWDAHKDAGTEDTPFDLQLPTWLDKTFSIRDYGTGIPHDKFEHIYTNVGSSTKDGNNDLIGGFGLGSKTPFTMTDTFMVENIHNKVKTTWVCFKDKGEPSVSKVDEVSTIEPSGLKVSFSFDNDMVGEFTRQVVKQLMFFPVKPNIVGGTSSDISFPTLPKNWETSEYFHTELSYPYVLMGNVAYQLDPYNLPYELRDLLTDGLVIRANIGDVDIPPSREHIEMTDVTLNFLKSKIVMIKKKYQQDVQDMVDECTYEWEALSLLAKHNSKLYDINKIQSDLLSPSDSRYAIFHCRNAAGYPIYLIHTYYKNKYKVSSINFHSFNYEDNTYYLNDLGTGGNKHINDNYQTLEKGCVIFHVSGISKKNRDTLVTTALKEIKEVVGKTPVLLSSIIGHVPAKAKTTRISNYKGASGIFTAGHKFANSPKASLKEVTDVPTDGYYLVLDGFQVEHQLHTLVSRELPLLLGKPVYLVRKRAIKNLPDTVVHLSSRTFIKGLVEEKVNYLYRKSIIIDALRYAKLNLCSYDYTPLFKVMKTNHLERYVKLVKRLEKVGSPLDSQAISNIQRELGIKKQDVDYESYTGWKRLQTLQEGVKDIITLLQRAEVFYGSVTEVNQKTIEILARLIQNQK